MKRNKVSRILGIGLTIAVLASMFVVSAPASAGTLAFSSEGSGATLPIKTGTDILDIAVAGNGSTVYAALGTYDYQPTTPPDPAGIQALLKSTNGGATWAGVNTNTATSTVSVSKISVAPDVADGSFVAAVLDNGGGNVVAISSDGGVTWSIAPALPGGVATRIEVSRPIGTTRTLGVASSDGNVYTLDMGGVFGGTWVNVSTISTTQDMTPGTVRDLAFSPNFPGDRTLAVVTDNASDVFVQLYNTASLAWNGTVYPGWAAGVDVTGAALSGAVTAAAVTLAPNFLGNDPSSRTIYIALTAATTSGLYRVVDTGSAQLSTLGLNSVAVNAAGDKLVAGACLSNAVIRVASPATATAASPLPASKKPAGPMSDSVVVAFAGATVVTGTSNIDSAFSKSSDDGKSFIDISLVDSAFGPVDFAVAADGGKIYVTSVSGNTSGTTGVLSVYRKATAWERVLAVGTTSVKAVVHVAPDNADVVYVAETGGANQIYYSNDGGITTWTPRYSPNVVTDMAVETASIVYILSGTAVSKSVDSGFIWDNPKATLPSGMAGATITFISAGNLVVGGTAGEVAYSTDGNATWTKTGANVPAGLVQVTADKLATGGNVYAATSAAGSNIYRWVIGTSTVWAPMRTGTVAGGATGIGLAAGTLYVTAFDATAVTSSLNRTLSPATAVVDGNWSVLAAVTEVTATGTVYTLGLSDTPSALQISMGADKAPKLWALDLTNKRLESFTDILTTAAPAQTGPADAFIDAMNVETGGANNVVFQWTGVAGTPVTTTYNLQISLDSAFTQVVFGGVGYAPIATNLVIVGPSGTSPYPYQADTTYYWRIRIDAPIASAFSAVRSFKIDALKPLAISAPAGGASNVPVKPTFVWSPVTGATTYEIVVSDDPTFKIITFSRTSDKAMFAADEALAYGTVYYWRVRASAPTTAVTPFVTGIFTTEAKPVPPTSAAPPITITTQPPATITVEVPPPVEAIPAFLLWIIILIGAILVIALIVLIVRTRRTS